MPYAHEGIEFEVKKEWSLEELRTRLTWQQWEDRRKQGLVRMLLLRHPVGDEAYFAVEFEGGAKNVGLLAPGVIYNLSPARKEVEMAASPVKEFQKRMQQQREKDKAKHNTGGIADISRELREPKKLKTLTVAEIAQNRAAKEEIDEPEEPTAEKFPSTINGSWGMLCENKAGNEALFLNFDRTFDKFRFCVMDLKGNVRSHHQPVEWEQWSL